MEEQNTFVDAYYFDRLLSEYKKSTDEMATLYEELRTQKEELLRLIEAERSQLVLAHHHMQIAKKNKNEDHFLLAMGCKEQAMQFAIERKTTDALLDEAIEKVSFLEARMKIEHEGAAKFAKYHTTKP